MIFTISVILSVVALLVVLAPFFWGPHGSLQAAAAFNDPRDLEAMKITILQRFIADEASYKKQELTEREWKERQELLLRKYLDAARRLDIVAGGKRA